MGELLDKIKFSHVAILFAVIIVVMVATGNMGGAKKATGNYIKVRGQSSSMKGEVRPNPMAQLIEYNKSKNK
jgi:hypothetical protein